MNPRLTLALAALIALWGLAAGSAAAAASSACGAPAARPWCDQSLGPGKRASLLLEELTRSEKISLLGGDELGGVAGGEGTHTGTSDGIARVGLPTIHLTDGPVGIRSGRATAMPVAEALAAGFDPRMARRMGARIGIEARLKGNEFLFAPTIETTRTPIAGRTFENFGEDPMLSSALAVPWIRGAQSQGVIATVKHFAPNTQEGTGPLANQARPGNQLQALGIYATEGARGSIDVNVDERTLHELYLPQFEAAVKRGGAGAVMCAYNKLGGAHSCENEFLLEQTLRRRWGFDGLTIADYAGAHDTAASLANGLDFEPWPGVVYGPPRVEAALAQGASMADVDAHVFHYLRTLFAFGVIDRGPYPENEDEIDAGAGARTARLIAERGITLLRNERHALPLDEGDLDSLALIGPTIDSNATGGGSSEVDPLVFTSPLAAIERKLGDDVALTAYEGSDPAEAAAAAKGTDVAVVIAPDFETEGVDRACLRLECPPAYGNLDALIAAVAEANPSTVVVLETGAPVLTPWRSQIDALLEAWYPGAGAGPAIARVLFGDTDPGGRLPLTFPRSESQLPTAGDPSRYPGVDNEVDFGEGIFVGYRHYDENGLEPAYPFGHGLSYTRFRFSDLRIDRTGRPAENGVRVRIRVDNVGERTGFAVPQLYLGLPSSKAVPQPPRALKGFRKLRLPPGASRTVSFPLDRRALSYWDARRHRWRVARGCYRAFVGSSSRRLPLRGSFAIDGRCGRTTRR